MVDVKRHFSPVNIYFALWCMYRLQGVIYPAGSIISKFILMAILLWSMISLYRVNTRYQIPFFFKATNIFLLFTTFYGVILIISGQELYVTAGDVRQASNIDYLKNIYMSILPIYFFYDNTRSGSVSINSIMVFTICLLLVGIVNYIHDMNEAIILANQIGSPIGAITSNIGYNFVALMPLLIFWNNKPLAQYVLLIVVMFFVIVCMKRGAILIGGICFAYFLYTMYSRSRGRIRSAIFLLSIISLAALIYVVIGMIDNNALFAYRVEQTMQGYTSQRDQLYKTFYNYFISEHNLFRFLFGNGANATLKIGNNFAHNDWLELAINNGIVGVALYGWYFIALYKDYKCQNKAHLQYSNVILMALIIMFASSMFSMSYASLDKAISIALGFVLAQNSKNCFVSQKKVSPPYKR